MATAAQITANQANALLSTGPKSAEGKQTSSRNATRRGLAGAVFAILPNEDAAGFENLRATLDAEYSPDGDTETFLLDQMAKARWKIMRIERLEAEAFEEILTAPADGAASSDGRVLQTISAPGNILDKLQRYSAAAERSYYKALRELEHSRARRQQAEATALENYLTKFVHAPLPGYGYIPSQRSQPETPPATSLPSVPSPASREIRQIRD